MEPIEVARAIVDALEEKKAEDIVLMEIKDIALFADYFVICSGTSGRMLKALMDAAIEEVRANYDLRTRVEGEPQDGWMLADFGDVVVHVFSENQRAYYRLEDLWADGRVLLHLQ